MVVVVATRGGLAIHELVQNVLIRVLERKKGRGKKDRRKVQKSDRTAHSHSRGRRLDRSAGAVWSELSEFPGVLCVCVCVRERGRE